MPYKNGKKWVVVVDEQTGPEYDVIQVGPIFQKNGSVEYIVENEALSLIRVNYKPQ